MKALVKTIIAGTLTLSMLALTACGGTTGSDKTGNGGSADGAKGRYLEEEIKIPEENCNILDIQQLDNGTIRAITYLGIYDSTDGGKNFTYLEESAAIWGEAEDSSIYTAHCSSSGEMIIQKSSTIEKDGAQLYTSEFLHIDKDFNVTPLKINIPDVLASQTIDLSIPSTSETGDAPAEEAAVGEGATEEIDSESQEGTEDQEPNMVVEGGFNQEDAVSDMFFLPNGNYLVTTNMGGLYQIDKTTGEVVAAYDSGEALYDLTSYAIMDNKLIIFADSIVAAFDFESGTVVDIDTTLKDLMPNTQNDISFVGAPPVLLTQDEDSLYYVNSEGIYRYTLGSELTEEMANASLNSLSNPEYILSKFLKTVDNEFYVATNGSSRSSTLLKYTYSADVLTTPSHQINVYALQDNDSIRQAISVYQKNNPDVFVKLEIGMPDEGSVTAADAIRTLNTNIVAGTGPDILILDGLPIDSYMEKDSLVDLTGVINEVNESEGLFENIVNTYTKDDGIYAVPTKFAVDFLVGKKDILSTYSDLKGLASVVKAYKEANPEAGNVINAKTAEALVNNLYNTSSNAWINEDGTLNEAALTEFVNALKDIYQTIDTQAVDDSIHISANAATDAVVMDLIASNYPMSVVSLTSLQSFIYVKSGADQLEDSDYTMFNGQTEKSYTPKATVGISAKSKNQDIAKDFIKVLLSAETQSSNMNLGIPVNKIAYDTLAAVPNGVQEDRVYSSFVTQSDDGTMSFLTVKWPEDEEFAKLKTSLESLEVASDTSTIIKEAIISHITQGLEADTPVDEMVASILKTVNLYLSE